MTNALDIPRLYTAFAEWGACMVYVLQLKKRYSSALTVVFSAVSLAALSIFMDLTGNVPVIWWLPCMAIAVLWMIFTIYFLTDSSWYVAIYCGSCAFLIAEFAASLEWQLDSFTRFFHQDKPWLNVLIFFLIFAIVFVCAYFIEKNTITDIFLEQITQKELFSALAMSIMIFGFSNLDYIRNSTPFAVTSEVDILKFRTLIDAFGLAILYSFQLRICEYLAHNEISTVRSMLKNQYDQYRYYQSSMEMIHIKYHDLKHQIMGLRYETDNEKRQEWIDMLEKELDENRIVDRTGNQVLDTMLGAKVFQARKNQIRITCVADGKLLDFMHVTDICTIFGNALDNAIESAVLIENPEKRLIHVTVTSQKNFIRISISNYFEGNIDISGSNLPKTTKQDSLNHGYGLKSIRYTVEKYQGSMNVSAKENWFEVKILMPKQ